MKKYFIFTALTALMFSTVFSFLPIAQAANLPDLTKEPYDWSRLKSCSRKVTSDVPGYAVAEYIATNLNKNLDNLYQYSGASAPLVLYVENSNRAYKEQITKEVTSLLAKADTDEARFSQQLDQAASRASDMPYALTVISRERAVLKNELTAYRSGVESVNTPILTFIESAESLSASSSLGSDLRKIEAAHRAEVQSLIDKLIDRCGIKHNAIGMALDEAQEPSYPSKFQSLLKSVTSNYYSQIQKAFSKVYTTQLQTLKSERSQKLNSLQIAYKTNTAAAITRVNTGLQKASNADKPSERAFCSATNLANLSSQLEDRMQSQQALLDQQNGKLVEKVESRRANQQSRAQSQVNTLRSQLSAAVLTARAAYAANAAALSALTIYETSGNSAINTYETELSTAMATRVSEESLALSAQSAIQSAVLATHRANVQALIQKAKNDCSYSDSEQFTRVNSNASRDYKSSVSSEIRRYISDLKSKNSSLATSSKITAAQRKFDASALSAQTKVKSSLKAARDVFRAAVKVSR